MNYSVGTDIGKKRQHNEDSFFASDMPLGPLDNLFVVADGMGGHKAGDVASGIAVNTVSSLIGNLGDVSRKEALSVALKQANSDILYRAAGTPELSGMGTTLVMCTISDILTVLNIGDSRLYVLRDGELIQITRDHTVVEEMLRMGSISRDAAQRHPKRHMLTRALGAEENAEGDIFEISLNGVSQILMATDGLYNMVSKEQIRDVLAGNNDTESKTKQLIDMANEMGGEDNITVLLIDMTR